MKRLIIIFFILPLISLQAFELDNIFNSSKTTFSFNSYFGTYYLPKKSYKKLSYIDKHYLDFGLNYDILENLFSRISIGLNEKFIEKEILLNEIKISYKMNDFRYSYKYDDFQFGEKSEIFSSNVNSKYYQKGILEDYKLSGIETYYSKNSFSSKIFIGSNNFNRGSFIASTIISKLNNNIELSFFYSMNNQEYSEISYSLIFEHRLDHRIFGSYNTFEYEIMPELLKGNKYKIFSEQRISFDKISAFINIFYEEFEDIKDSYNCESSSMLKYESQRGFSNLIYRYNTVSEFGDSYFVRDYTSIIGFKFIEEFKLALNYSYFEPSIGDNYYNLGLQIEFNYETE